MTRKISIQWDHIDWTVFTLRRENESEWCTLWHPVSTKHCQKLLAIVKWRKFQCQSSPKFNATWKFAQINFVSVSGSSDWADSIGMNGNWNLFFLLNPRVSRPSQWTLKLQQSSDRVVAHAVDMKGHAPVAEWEQSTKSCGKPSEKSGVIV